MKIITWRRYAIGKSIVESSAMLESMQKLE